MFRIPALFLLAIPGLASTYVLKWVREGYEEESAVDGTE
jgi:hypothetical protein